MNVIYTRLRAFSLGLFSFLLIFGTNPSNAYSQDGEKLFKSYCAACHSSGSNQLVGPGLAGATDRHDMEWLYEWVKDSPSMIESGEPKAVEIFEKFNKLLMPPQPVDNDEIDAIFAWVDEINAASAEGDGVASSGASSTVDEAEEADDSSQTTYIILAVVLALLVLVSILRTVQHSLKLVDAKRKGEELPEQESMWTALKTWIKGNKTIVALIAMVILVLVLKVGWDAALNIGVYTEYEPEQPIKFSHKLHAGENGIDCNYCHNTARNSQTAGIPSASTCMNCHTYITEGPEYGEEEIAKIYAALDFDPVTKTYGSNQKPIKWVKVHNLPDLSYFNHSQHVTVGKIACQECHGPVETFTVGKQHSSLTMGWCVDCHRETKVQMENNGYYDEIHKRLPEKLREEFMKDGKITVSELGGIECAKCHY